MRVVHTKDETLARNCRRALYSGMITTVEADGDVVTGTVYSVMRSDESGRWTIKIVTSRAASKRSASDQGEPPVRS